MIRPDTPPGSIVWDFDGLPCLVHAQSNKYGLMLIRPSGCSWPVPYILADLFYTQEEALRARAVGAAVMIRDNTPPGTVVWTFGAHRATIVALGKIGATVRTQDGNVVGYIFQDLFYTRSDAERERALWALGHDAP